LICYFDMLSFEMQIHIFSYIKSPILLYCCSIVCDNWRRKILEQRLGFHTAFTAIKNATFGDPFTSNFNSENPYHKEINISPQSNNTSPNKKKEK